MRVPKRAGEGVQPTAAYALEESWDSYRVCYEPAGIAIDYRVTAAMLARMVRQGVRVHMTLTTYPQGTYRGEMYRGRVRWIECHVDVSTRCRPTPDGV